MFSSSVFEFSVDSSASATVFSPVTFNFTFSERFCALLSSSSHIFVTVICVSLSSGIVNLFSISTFSFPCSSDYLLVIFYL